MPLIIEGKSAIQILSKGCPGPWEWGALGGPGLGRLRVGVGPSKSCVCYQFG